MIPPIRSCPVTLKYTLRGVLRVHRQELSVTAANFENSEEIAKYQTYVYKDNAVAKTERQENARRFAASFEPDTDHCRIFPTVPVITQPELRKFMHDVLKLRFVKEREGDAVTARWRPVEGVGTSAPQSGCLELLHNIASKHDYWLISKRFHRVLYYRLELMRQRLEYLRSVGLDERQKLREIQKRPPPLVFTMTNSTYYGKLVYLRGLVPKGDGSSLHVYSPIGQDLRDNKVLIEERVKSVGLQLKLTTPAVLQELFNMPCFFMDPVVFKLGEHDHLFAHLRSMPKYYNIDRDTLQMMPPICNLESLGIKPDKHLRWKTAKKDLIEMPTFTPQQVLDVSYPVNNGKGTPECLSSYLLRTDLEEMKDKPQGGKFKKPRRGFNMPPRQY